MKGLDLVPLSVTSIPLHGTTFTIQDLKLKLANYEMVFDNMDKAEIAFEQALDARNQIDSEARELMSTLKALLKAVLGKNAPELQSFGFSPDKSPEPLTVAAKQMQVAKSKATRIARHTMGPKQKAKIKGQVSPRDAPVPPDGSGPVNA